ncbi:MAG: AraC family transcriptional regulator [Mycobacterium sp.]
MTDELSTVFDVVQIRGIVTGGFAVGGQWTTRFDIRDPLKLIAMVRGSAQLETDGAPAPVNLAAGDVAILNNRSWVVLTGGSGPGFPRPISVTEADTFARIDGIDSAASDIDVCVGGHVDVNEAGRQLLTTALPPVGHVRAGRLEASGLHATLDRLVDEVTGNRLGAAFAVQQYGQLLLLDVLRAYLAQQAELPQGWLRALTDDRLRPALHLMHSAPGKPWRLDELAKASAMSRTSFAERFRSVTGVPPLSYLSSWRMLLARRALREADTRVGDLAFELGYTSESAFSNAFKREVGMSPLRYRAAAR